jgi:hypothetical protein
MSCGAYIPYGPLNTLKPFAEEVWIVDGAEIDFHYFGVTLPVSTRMTVVRLSDGDILVHSPTAWDPDLAAEIEALGSIRHLVAPATLHYWYLPEWQARFPEARSYGPPGFGKAARRRVQVDEQLACRSPASWGGDFEQCMVSGGLFTEVDFFHRPSRTLILTDIIENFEPARIRRPVLRWTMEAFGAADPDGKAPIDMQLSFFWRRRQVRAAARQMIAWSPEQIVIAHGRCYRSNAVEELRRAFRWVSP